MSVSGPTVIMGRAKSNYPKPEKHFTNPAPEPDSKGGSPCPTAGELKSGDPSMDFSLALRDLDKGRIYEGVSATTEFLDYKTLDLTLDLPK